MIGTVALLLSAYLAFDAARSVRRSSHYPLVIGTLGFRIPRLTYCLLYAMAAGLLVLAVTA